MYWYNYLYADKKVHHISRLKYKIEKGMPHKGVYLIHLPECGIIDEVYREQGNFDIPSYLQIGRGSMPESGVTQP